MSIDRIRNETLRQNPDEDQPIQWMRFWLFTTSC